MYGLTKLCSVCLYSRSLSRYDVFLINRFKKVINRITFKKIIDTVALPANSP